MNVLSPLLVRRLTLCALLILQIFSFASIRASAQPTGFVYVEGEYLMLNGERFIVKGYNYLPRDYGWTSLADWDWEAVDREFALARAYGANAIRTGFAWTTATGDPTCERLMTMNRVRPGYLEAIHRLVSLAEKHNLRLILWLGDLCATHLDPANYPALRRYIESIVTEFEDNPWILAWDLQTDVDGFVLQGFPGGCFGEVPHCNKTDMLNMLRYMADAIRQMDPNHLITVGFCWPTSSILAQDFTDFLMPQMFGGDAPNILTGEGPGQIEGYGWGAGTGREIVTRTLEEKIRYMQSHLSRPMPIVVAEYGSPSAGQGFTPDVQKFIYEAYLEVIFLRLKLAGALNWVLTDFIWPPKAQPFAFLDSPLPVTEQNFGILFLDYSPKPSAEVARAYYADAPTIAIKNTPEVLRFIFSQTFVPGPPDLRQLAVAFDYVSFLAEDGTTLMKIDIGDPSARPYLGSGFFDDEGPWEGQAENFAWAGGPTRTAQVIRLFPEGTRAIAFRVENELAGMQATISIDDRLVEVLSLETGWKTYTVQLPGAEPLTVGSTYTVSGRFNLPVSEGTLTLQTSHDGISWQDVGSVVPVQGRFSFNLPLDQAGTLWLRAVWSGAGLYQAASSEPIALEVASPPATPTAPPLPATESPAAPAAFTPGMPATLYVGAGLVVLIAGTIALLALRRRKS